VKDLATSLGIGLAFVVVIASNIMEGGDPTSLLLLPPMLLVFGTTILITVAGGTMADAKGAVSSLKRAFAGGPQSCASVVPAVVGLAEQARREGLLSLEDRIRDMDDDFLARGVTLAIDGTDPEEVREIMEAEVSAARKGHKQSAKFYSDAGAYAPTIGIIGTVMGLVHVLENLAQPEELGHLIAAAFVATLWGVTSANVLFLPIGNRLKRLGELEVARMELIVEGVAAIQAGANPRTIAQKLGSLVPPAEQAPVADAA
jgi:chemotaxis protein MotA